MAARIFSIVGLSAGLALTHAYGVEVQPTADLQVQAQYLKTTAEDSGDWSVQMPHSEFGVSAVEMIDGGRFSGRLSFLAETSPNSSVTLSQRLAFLSWQQGFISLSAGQLPTLEYSYLESGFEGLYSLPSRGIGLSQHYAENEQQAVRVEARSGDYLVWAGQWVLAEGQGELPWHTAGALQTPEGHIALTYRKAPGEPAFWGNEITWKGAEAELSAIWGFQEELLEWDLFVSFQPQALRTTVGYGASGDDASRWSLGLYQILSPAVTSYSELIRWTESDDWHWSAGFNMTF